MAIVSFEVVCPIDFIFLCNSGRMGGALTLKKDFGVLSALVVRFPRIVNRSVSNLAKSTFYQYFHHFGNFPQAFGQVRAWFI